MYRLLEENQNHHLFFCKVCSNGSLKLGTMEVGAPRNHMKPSKDPEKKTKHERNVAVSQKPFSISSLVGKLSAIRSKDPSSGNY